MLNKISHALNDNKHFWKEMQKLRLLLTIDDALCGFSPDELNTHFSAILVSSLEDSTKFYNHVSTVSPIGFSFQPVTVNDIISAVAHWQ